MKQIDKDADLFVNPFIGEKLNTNYQNPFYYLEMEKIYDEKEWYQAIKNAAKRYNQELEAKKWVKNNE
jgi:hypothetical protein